MKKILIFCFLPLFCAQSMKDGDGGNDPKKDNAEDVSAEVPASNIQAPEVNAAEVPASNMQAPEVNVAEIPASNMQAPEVSAAEVPASNIQAPEVSAAEVPASNIQDPALNAKVSASNTLGDLKKIQVFLGNGLKTSSKYPLSTEQLRLFHDFIQSMEKDQKSPDFGQKMESFLPLAPEYHFIHAVVEEYNTQITSFSDILKVLNKEKMEKPQELSLRMHYKDATECIEGYFPQKTVENFLDLVFFQVSWDPEAAFLVENEHFSTSYNWQKSFKNVLFKEKEALKAEKLYASWEGEVHYDDFVGPTDLYGCARRKDLMPWELTFSESIPAFLKTMMPFLKNSRFVIQYGENFKNIGVIHDETQAQGVIDFLKIVSDFSKVIPDPSENFLDCIFPMESGNDALKKDNADCEIKIPESFNPYFKNIPGGGSKNMPASVLPVFRRHGDVYTTIDSAGGYAKFPCSWLLDLHFSESLANFSELYPNVQIYGPGLEMLFLNQEKSSSVLKEVFQAMGGLPKVEEESCFIYMEYRSRKLYGNSRYLIEELSMGFNPGDFNAITKVLQTVSANYFNIKTPRVEGRFSKTEGILASVGKLVMAPESDKDIPITLWDKINNPDGKPNGRIVFNAKDFSVFKKIVDFLDDDYLEIHCPVMKGFFPRTESTLQFLRICIADSEVSEYKDSIVFVGNAMGKKGENRITFKNFYFVKEILDQMVADHFARLAKDPLHKDEGYFEVDTPNLKGRFPLDCSVLTWIKKCRGNRCKNHVTLANRDEEFRWGFESQEVLCEFLKDDRLFSFYTTRLNIHVEGHPMLGNVSRATENDRKKIASRLQNLGSLPLSTHP